MLNGLKYSVWTSRGAGLVLAFDGGMIVVPSTAFLTDHVKLMDSVEEFGHLVEAEATMVIPRR